MRSQARQCGVAIIEFALILPLLLILSFITVEFGRALHEYNTVTRSVRDAARYLSMQQPGTQQDVARNIAVFGRSNPSGDAQPVARGLSTDKVLIETGPAAGSSPPMNVVTVRVEGYVFDSMFTGAFGMPLADIMFSNISATMRSYQ